MKKYTVIFIVILIASISSVKAINYTSMTRIETNSSKDSLRLAELDYFWTELSRTVNKGDFEGYKAAYHDDAVVIFASGKNKVSLPISTALANWKQGFSDTKAGKTSDSVEFRFSQRINDGSTAHETGIFHFKSIDSNGKVRGNSLVHFEMLLVKRNDVWIGLMEYQKSEATEKDWASLE
ncbi:MAG: nuclear transport factor 2 family protein [Saprospiraceae bacterium]|nr:nuclear transport factor 2 family protein [Saprospiraceae bacterium]|tara:strand:- start:4579 stop:5118 length:540 start_codon:yes stop_codon:yes gene_type:complete